MPIGIIVNSLSIFFGGLLGSLLGHKLKESFCNNLTLIFGVCSMSMGINNIVKLENLPPVILSVIIGVIIGQWIHLEEKIALAAEKLKTPIAKIFHTQNTKDEEQFINKFISIVVLFCASGTGIFGALHSGITGEHTILFTKSILDFFTAIIFAASLGYIVITTAFLQFSISILLFLVSGFIMPLTTSSMLADFSACGGILMLAAGFRIAGIKNFPIADMIPAMFFVMPFSAVWVVLFH